MLPAELKERFAAAVRRMLRPVVRQLIRYGISYPTLDQMIRELFVEVAEHDFPLDYKKQTDSRVSVLTGLNRKEVSRLRRKARIVATQTPVEDTITTRIIGRWMGGPPYSDASGRPNALPYESARADSPSFTRLVQDRSVDAPARSVLDELIRQDLVELRKDDKIVLQQEANIPNADLEGKLTLMASDPGELFRTIVHNVEHPDAPWLQRKVVYDNIGSEALAELREAARATGEEFVRRANILLAAHDRDRNPQAPAGARARVALGVYYFEEEGDDAATVSAETAVGDDE
ncbi:MAG: DUF6502 family protein [Deltaproteobacteria bacterium]